jgi:hypothetical protein
MSLSFIVGQTLKARLPCVESVEAAVTQQPYKMLPDVPPCDVREAPYTDFLWKNPSAWLSHGNLVLKTGFVIDTFQIGMQNEYTGWAEASDYEALASLFGQFKPCRQPLILVW